MLGKSDGTKTVTQEFDLLNRMTSYSDDTVTATYTYYPDNMRRSKTGDNSTTTHIWLGSEIALDITGGNVVSYIGGVKSDYGWYLYNAHGDVVQIADDFGNSIVQDDENDKNPYRYCGEYLDFESGYVYLRARYYDSKIGRFISEDPAFDGYNWYAYCGGNPLKYCDPSGMFFWFAAAAAVAITAMFTGCQKVPQAQFSSSQAPTSTTNTTVPTTGASNYGSTTSTSITTTTTTMPTTTVQPTTMAPWTSSRTILSHIKRNL